MANRAVADEFVVWEELARTDPEAGQTPKIAYSQRLVFNPSGVLTSGVLTSGVLTGGVLTRVGFLPPPPRIAIARAQAAPALLASGPKTALNLPFREEDTWP